MIQHQHGSCHMHAAYLVSGWTTYHGRWHEPHDHVWMFQNLLSVCCSDCCLLCWYHLYYLSCSWMNHLSCQTTWKIMNMYEQHPRTTCMNNWLLHFEYLYVVEVLWSCWKRVAEVVADVVEKICGRGILLRQSLEYFHSPLLQLFKIELPLFSFLHLF
jgi:hypothetical protein